MDDDDKIRRNLVVASSVIIAVAWLGVPLPDLVERLFSLKNSTSTSILSDWKVWAAVLAVLAYLALRYRWSKEVEEGIAAHEKAARARYIKIYRRKYTPELTKWIMAASIAGDAAPGMQHVLGTILGGTPYQKYGAPARVQWNVPDEGGFAPSPTSGNTGVTVEITWSIAGGSEHTDIVTLNLPIDVKRQKRYWLSARLHAHVYSQGAMALLFPAAIAAVAGAIAIWKLCRSVAATFT